jgi:predicted esterase
MFFCAIATKGYTQITDSITSRFLQELKEENYVGAVACFSEELKEEKDTAWLSKKHKAYISLYGEPEVRSHVIKTFYGGKNLIYRFLWYGDQSCKLRFVLEKGEFSEFNMQIEAITNNYSTPEDAKREDVVVRPVLIRSGKYALPGEIVEGRNTETKKWAVLVHGSGPNNRDEAMLGNRPFRDIAYGLAVQGIATIRYDKNTYVFGQELAKEKGMTMWDETGADALAAVDYLQNFESAQLSDISIIGHSQGAMMIPAIADSVTPASFVMIAGNARPLHELIYEQFRFLMKKDGLSDSEKQRLEIQQEQIENLDKLEHTHPDSVDFALPYGLPAHYWKYLLNYDQQEKLKSVNSPVLLIQGKGDYQVRMKDFRKFRRALWKSDVEWKALAYEKVNHILFENEGEPSREEYERSENVEKYIIDDIAEWILAH